MMFYVRRAGRIVGWVIAANEREALIWASEKYPAWDFELLTVEVRR